MTAVTYYCNFCGRPIAGFPMWANGYPYHGACMDPPHLHSGYAPNPNPGAGCQPLIQLTEDDVRRIVREEMVKAAPPTPEKERSAP